MITINDVREGSKVIVRGDFGMGLPHEVIVENVEQDIKNGQPGIDYDVAWAYLHQIDRVVEY